MGGTARDQRPSERSGDRLPPRDPIESEYVERMRTTAVHRWLVAHAEAFGFYPYDVEPWHWEYNPPAATLEPEEHR